MTTKLKSLVVGSCRISERQWYQYCDKTVVLCRVVPEERGYRKNSVVGSLDPLNYMNVGMTRTESLPLQVQYPIHPPNCTGPNE